MGTRQIALGIAGLELLRQTNKHNAEHHFAGAGKPIRTHHQDCIAFSVFNSGEFATISAIAITQMRSRTGLDTLKQLANPSARKRIAK